LLLWSFLDHIRHLLDFLRIYFHTIDNLAVNNFFQLFKDWLIKFVVQLIDLILDFLEWDIFVLLQLIDDLVAGLDQISPRVDLKHVVVNEVWCVLILSEHIQLLFCVYAPRIAILIKVRGDLLQSLKTLINMHKVFLQNCILSLLCDL